MASLFTLHLSALCFLLLESLIILATSIPRDQNKLLSSLLISSPPVCILVSGLAPGLLYTLALVLVLQPDLVSSQLGLCWLDMTSPGLTALFLGPVSLLSLSSLCVMIASWCHDPSELGRSVARTRPCVLLSALLESLACVLGPAAHTPATAHPAVVLGYQGVRAGLAIAITLRTLLDDQVRLIIIIIPSKLQRWSIFLKISFSEMFIIEIIESQEIVK